MIPADFSQNEPVKSQTGRLPWIETIGRMLDYYPEACGFIQRASEHFPVTQEHTLLLLQLWTESDVLDGVILPKLSELNCELHGGKGILDTTRGVSTRQSALSEMTDEEGEEVVFEFTWSLNWAAGGRVSVIFSCDEHGVRDVIVRGGTSTYERRVRYPITGGSVEEALTMAYVAEVTSLQKS